jgi:hypothetical protein
MHVVLASYYTVHFETRLPFDAVQHKFRTTMACRLIHPGTTETMQTFCSLSLVDLYINHIIIFLCLASLMFVSSTCFPCFLFRLIPCFHIFKAPFGPCAINTLLSAPLFVSLEECPFRCADFLFAEVRGGSVFAGVVCSLIVPSAHCDQPHVDGSSAAPGMLFTTPGSHFRLTP